LGYEPFDIAALESEFNVNSELMLEMRELITFIVDKQIFRFSNADAAKVYQNYSIKVSFI